MHYLPKLLCFLSAEGIKAVMVKNDSVPINSENFTLTCEVIGPYDSIYWMRDNVHLSSNTTVSIENNSLHFNPVTMYNDGTYQCVATNLIGPHRSPEYELLVNCECCFVDPEKRQSRRVHIHSVNFDQL